MFHCWHDIIISLLNFRKEKQPEQLRGASDCQYKYMSNNNTNYVRLSRDIFSDKYKDISTSAKWLYCVLTNLEYKYRSEKNNVFYRANTDLVNDSGMSLASVKRAKKELLDAGLIETRQVHFKDVKADDRSRKHITGFILH